MPARPRERRGLGFVNIYAGAKLLITNWANRTESLTVALSLGLDFSASDMPYSS
jgi:hypothetical protein